MLDRQNSKNSNFSYNSNFSTNSKFSINSNFSNNLNFSSNSNSCTNQNHLTNINNNQSPASSTDEESTNLDKNQRLCASQLLNTKKSRRKVKQIKQLKIMHYNCNSIIRKVDLLDALIKKVKPDIISLNEIKCSEAEANNIFNFNNYMPFFKCRDSSGGGVCILVHDNIECTEIEQISPNLECVGIKAKINNKYYSIYSYYNPPHEIPNKEFFTKVQATQKNYLILGDLNARMKSFNNNYNKNGHVLESIIADIDGQILNNKMDPTNYRFIEEKASHAVLDYGIGNGDFIQKFYEYETLRNTALSVYEKKYYHIPIVFKFDIARLVKVNNQSKNKSYLYQRADWTKFRNMQDNLIQEKAKNDEINMDNSEICQAIKEAADKSIPMACKATDKPIRYPPHIINLFNSAKFWQRQHTKRHSDYTRENLYSVKSCLDNELIKFKSNQWQEFLNRLGKDKLSTVPFWRRINRFRFKKKSKNIGTILHDKTVIDTDEGKAEAFSSRLFATFNTNENERYDESHKKMVEKFFEENKIEQLYEPSEKSPILFNDKELDCAIKRLNNKTSIDGYGISNKMLGKVSEKMRKKILCLFNNCLKTFKVPDEWKSSTVIMLPKAGTNLTDPRNYRPISITACIARLFERLILVRLQNHLSNNNLIIDQQSGFRKNRSTKDNLIFLTQKIGESLRNKWNMVNIYFDIAGAFDKVWHQGLIYKIIKMKVPFYLIKIIENFLHERSFVVKVGDAFSSKRAITIGVPQGGVLSPTLFNIFINDSPIQAGKNKAYTLIFADDICLGIIFKNKTDNLEQKINEYLAELESWTNSWRLTLAPHKCQYIVFTNGQTVDEFSLKLYGHELEHVDCPKFLGIRFDRKLTFSNQIEHIITSCNNRLNVIKTLSHAFWSIDEKTLLNLYMSLVRSLIDYSSFTVTNLNKSDISLLQVMQNTALRCIYKKPRETPIKELHKLANIDTIENRMRKLNEKYFEKAASSYNPIVERLIEEYKDEFMNKTRASKSTLLCEIALVHAD
jgi:hypothetical protein